MATVRTPKSVIIDALDATGLECVEPYESIEDLADDIILNLPDNTAVVTDVAAIAAVLQESLDASVADTGNVLPKTLRRNIGEVLEAL